MVSLRYWPPNTLLILRPPIFPNTGDPPIWSRSVTSLSNLRHSALRNAAIYRGSNRHAHEHAAATVFAPTRPRLPRRLARDSLSTDGAWRAWNPEGSQEPRGFESHPLRQGKQESHWLAQYGANSKAEDFLQ